MAYPQHHSAVGDLDEPQSRPPTDPSLSRGPLEGQEPQLQSPEKYRSVVRHLVQYTAALALLAHPPAQATAQPQPPCTTQEQDEERRQAWQALQREEAVLARLCPPPSPSSLCPAPPLQQLAGHAKHAYLLGTLNDLKQRVLQRPGQPQDRVMTAQPDDWRPPLPPGTTLEPAAGNDEDCESDAGSDRGDQHQEYDQNRQETEDGKKVKRLNKSCTAALTRWLLEHLSSPFPSPQQKQQLAAALGLEPAQVGNWMTNMRKRHVYPVLSGKKKAKSALELAILQQRPAPSRSSSGGDDEVEMRRVRGRCDVLDPVGLGGDTSCESRLTGSTTSLWSDGAQRQHEEQDCALRLRFQHPSRDTAGAHRGAEVEGVGTTLSSRDTTLSSSSTISSSGSSGADLFSQCAITGGEKRQRDWGGADDCDCDCDCGEVDCGGLGQACRGGERSRRRAWAPPSSNREQQPYAWLPVAEQGSDLGEGSFTGQLGARQDDWWRLDQPHAQATQHGEQEHVSLHQLLLEDQDSFAFVTAEEDETFRQLCATWLQPGDEPLSVHSV